MLNIYTDSKLANKPCLINIEAEFNLKQPMIDSMYKDEKSMYVLKELEGITTRECSSIMDISDSCKAILLCLSDGKERVICIDEASNNAVRLLPELSKDTEINILTHRVLKNFKDAFKCYVNNELCTGENITYALAELLDKEL
jgi:hypothetical protein